MIRDTEYLENRAGFLFSKLKETMLEIESLGKRPIVTTHQNGMLDTMRIELAHATTPEIDRIRAEKKGAVPLAA